VTHVTDLTKSFLRQAAKTFVTWAQFGQERVEIAFFWMLLAGPTSL
jgi:hypothetical protein